MDSGGEKESEGEGRTSLKTFLSPGKFFSCLRELVRQPSKHRRALSLWLSKNRLRGKGNQSCCFWICLRGERGQLIHLFQVYVGVQTLLLKVCSRWSAPQLSKPPVLVSSYSSRRRVDCSRCIFNVGRNLKKKNLQV